MCHRSRIKGARSQTHHSSRNPDRHAGCRPHLSGRLERGIPAASGGSRRQIGRALRRPGQQFLGPGRRNAGRILRCHFLPWRAQWLGAAARRNSARPCPAGRFSGLVRQGQSPRNAGAGANRRLRFINRTDRRQLHQGADRAVRFHGAAGNRRDTGSLPHRGPCSAANDGARTIEAWRAATHHASSALHMPCGPSTAQAPRRRFGALLLLGTGIPVWLAMRSNSRESSLAPEAAPAAPLE